MGDLMRYLTNDLAKLLGVTTNTIRRYEGSGFLKPMRDRANYRYYRRYDISKAAMIRLYIKCGFTHEEIRSMLGSTNSEIQGIFEDKLSELDRKIERLTKLRHWLKDNIQLSRTVDSLRGSFYIMTCPALRYVVYSEGGELTDDADRLETLRYFMYEAPEVQHINVFRYGDFTHNRLAPCSGWAVKEMDVAKFNMEDMICTNRCIEFYPSVKCLYGVMEMPAADIYDDAKLELARRQYLDNAKDHIAQSSLMICGDIVEFLVNALGDTVSILVCIPIKDI